MIAESKTVDDLLSSGSYRHDRHGSVAHLASPDYGDPIPRTDHELAQLVRNQSLYETLWGPVPSLHHPCGQASKLRAWLRTNAAKETPRGRLLLSKPEFEGIDKVTRRWIYNLSDLAASRNGCTFDEKRSRAVCDWMENNLVLYEGSAANKTFKLLAWQRELVSRLFGWVRFSEDHDKHVRRFTKATVFLPKKSGKSPLAAAVGLNLFLNDHEGGQKVFNIASVLKQATIVHKHAESFVRRKDRAKGKHNDWGCRIFKTLGDRRIGCTETNSEYACISGENPNSLEGLNSGGIIVDETHIMDSATASVIEEAGNSREQPLQFEVSTSGNNLHGYGKKQWDYGRAVERGDTNDDAFFYMGFGVFDESHHDLDDLETWQRCNPSWFVTIQPEGFLQSYDRARRKGIREFNKFCMYKLNKWISSASAWLDPEDWNLCLHEWNMMDFETAPIWLGVDLARCRDMSALTATALDDDRTLQRTWLWITEDYVEANQNRVDWRLWEGRGDLTIVPGSTIPTSWVRDQIEELDKTHDIQNVAFDRKFATELQAWMEHEAIIPHVEFPQTMQHMTEPLDAFEALVKEGGKLWINPNLCLSWQAGHCGIKEASNGGRLLQKPLAGEWKKIDGIVSSVMSLWASSSHIVQDTGAMFITG